MRKRAAGSSGLGAKTLIFVGRSTEVARFDVLLDVPPQSSLPVLSFFAPAGAGKSSLLKHLRNRARLVEVPTASLDLDAQLGGMLYQLDAGAALAEIRRQLGIDCPRFDLTYAMLRFKQGAGDEPLLKQGGAASTAWDFVCELATTAMSELPGASLGAWFARKIAQPLWTQIERTSFGAWIVTTAGNESLLELRRLSAQEIFPLLAEALGVDLELNLPPRNAQCQAVVFVDSLEHVVEDSTVAQSTGHWLRHFYEQTTNVLIVRAGRDALQWGAFDRAWASDLHLTQHALEGLNANEVLEVFKQRNVSHEHQESILKVAASGGEAGGYHALALTLACDLAETSDPVSESWRELVGAGFDALAERFLRALPDFTLRRWLVRLALPPHFDEGGARASHSETPSFAQDQAWEMLSSLSVLQDAEAVQGYRLHRQMRLALRGHLASAPKAWESEQAFWERYCEHRSQSDHDQWAMLAWFHRHEAHPAQAREEWGRKARTAYNRGSALDHERLLKYWDVTEVDGSSFHPLDQAHGCLIWASHLLMLRCGDRMSTGTKAIRLLDHAATIFREHELRREWIECQLLLGSAWSTLPSADAKAVVERALTHLNTAGEFVERHRDAASWARVRTIAAQSYARAPLHEQAENADIRIHLGLEVVSAAPDYRESHPMLEAVGHAVVANASVLVPGLSHDDRIDRITQHYEAGLTIARGADPILAAELTTDLSIALIRLSAQGPSNIQRAKILLHQQLADCRRDETPRLWAHINLALASLLVRDSFEDDGDCSSQSAECALRALEIFTETSDPRLWAHAQLALGYARFSQSQEVRDPFASQAVLALNLALSVFTLLAYPFEHALCQGPLLLIKVQGMSPDELAAQLESIELEADACVAATPFLKVRIAATCALLLGDSKKSETTSLSLLLRAVREAREQALPELGELLAHQAMVHGHLGDRAGQEAAALEAVDLLRRRAGYSPSARKHLARAFFQLGNAYAKRDEPEALRRATRVYDDGLRTVLPSQKSLLADINYNSGIAHGALLAYGDKTRETSIELLSQAHQFRTRSSDPLRWAEICTRLAEVLNTPPTDAPSLAAAASYAEKALEVLMEDDHPREWSRANAAYADAFATSPATVPIDLQTLEECYEKACRHAPTAASLTNLAFMIYGQTQKLNTHRRQLVAEYLRRALALSSRSLAKERRVQMLRVLGIVLLSPNPLASESHREGVLAFQEALSLCNPGTEVSAELHRLLASGLRLAKVTADPECAMRALEHAQAAVDLFGLLGNATGQAFSLLELGNCHLKRAAEVRTVSALLEATHCYERAEMLVPPAAVAELEAMLAVSKRQAERLRASLEPPGGGRRSDV